MRLKNLSIYFGGDLLKIGFIGAGKVGVSLGKYLMLHQKNVIGYYSKNPISAITATKFTNTNFYETIDSIVNNSDLIFLTVPDGIIQTVWDEIRHFALSGKILCHCSGSLSSTIFSEIDQLGAFGYSIHPLLAINSKTESYQLLSNAMFTLEGSKGKREYMLQFISSLGNKVQVIDTAMKVKYHAAVFVSNHVTALAYLGSKLLMECGFTEELAKEALSPLFLENATAIEKKGSIEALTGPVERNDIEVITKHLAELEHDTQKLYCLLTKILVQIAKKKHPHWDYKALETMIGEIA